MMFSIWDENNLCLSWDDTVVYAGVLGLELVPVLYRGLWDENTIRSLEQSLDLTAKEGYVVRLASSFQYGAFRRSVAKFVRAAHVGSSHNWMQKAVVKNGLKISP
jgi:hypothetical protein